MPSTRTRSRLVRLLRPFFGWLGLVVVVWGLTHSWPAGLLVVGSVILLLYFLFGTPTWCGAPIREEGQTCRNNAYGVLRGCHFRQHRWQKVTMAVHLDPRLGRAMFAGARPAFQAIGSLATVGASLAAIATYFLKK